MWRLGVTTGSRYSACRGRAHRRRAVPADGRFPGPAGDRAGRPRPSGQFGLGVRRMPQALQEIRETLSSAGVVFGGHRDRTGRSPGGRDDRFDDPSGNCWRPSTARPWNTAGSSALTATSSSPGNRVSGHVVLTTRDDDAVAAASTGTCSVSGCVTRCGCRRRWSAGPPTAPPAWLRFFGCNPRHHSLAFMPMPRPERHRAPDDRGGELRRRRSVPGPRAAQRCRCRRRSAGTSTT